MSRREIKSIKYHPIKGCRTVWCCRSAQFLYGTSLPHCWYEEHGCVFKWYYCPEHKPETEDTFKTKRELLAHKVTQALLNETEDLPPF